MNSVCCVVCTRLQIAPVLMKNSEVNCTRARWHSCGQFNSKECVQNKRRPSMGHIECGQAMWRAQGCNKHREGAHLRLTHFGPRASLYVCVLLCADAGLYSLRPQSARTNTQTQRPGTAWHTHREQQSPGLYVYGCAEGSSLISLERNWSRLWRCDCSLPAALQMEGEHPAERPTYEMMIRKSTHVSIKSSCLDYGDHLANWMDKNRRAYLLCGMKIFAWEHSGSKWKQNKIN